MKNHWASRILGPAFLVLSVLAVLACVAAVYMAGETLLAITLLVLAGLAFWIGTATRLYAYRYLFPGIAAALVFVVFPMAYTVRMGFTNYSSRNLLDFKQATKYLLDQTTRAEGASYGFTLHAQPDGRFRARLENPDTGATWASVPFAPSAERTIEAHVEPCPKEALDPEKAVEIKDLLDQQTALEAVTLVLPDGMKLKMTGLSEFAASQPLYRHEKDGSLVNLADGTVLRPNFRTGFYETPTGDPVEPGFQVNIGWENFKQIFTDARYREPFLRIFVWTVTFSACTVVFTACLGMLLAVLFNWEALRFKWLYRLLLILPYAVPSFISILVFKGLFNNNNGEVNLILSTLFGVKPTWFSDPFLAKTMLLIVNTWLGYPYMMVVCMGLIKAIPQDLYEASAVAGAGAIGNFRHITLPLILKPLTPLLIASFAFNFNNFMLISLLTGGRPDFLDTLLPSGTTDILVSYTYRVAFQDSGQKFGLAAATSTIIFLMVAALSIIQIRATKAARDDAR